MKIDGSCHCGFLTYQAEIDPARVYICHCTDCQTMSSSAFRVVVPAEPGTFRMVTGVPKTYVKTAESGNKRVQAFCPHCGTAIYAAAEVEDQRDRPPNMSLRVGAIKQRDQLKPKGQSWARSRQDWVTEIGALTARERG